MNSEFNATVGLIVYTTEPLSLITDIFATKPTKTVSNVDNPCDDQGEKQYNAWVLKAHHKQVHSIERCIYDFLGQIPDYSDKINKVKQYGNCVFRISIFSVYGQIGFSFSPQELLVLSQLNIPLEISILSFGNCKDE